MPLSRFRRRSSEQDGQLTLTEVLQAMENLRASVLRTGIIDAFEASWEMLQHTKRLHPSLRHPLVRDVIQFCTQQHTRGSLSAGKTAQRIHLAIEALPVDERDPHIKDAITFCESLYDPELSAIKRDTDKLNRWETVESLRRLFTLSAQIVQNGYEDEHCKTPPGLALLAFKKTAEGPIIYVQTASSRRYLPLQEAINRTQEIPTPDRQALLDFLQPLIPHAAAA